MLGTTDRRTNRQTDRRRKSYICSTDYQLQCGHHIISFDSLAQLLVQYFMWTVWFPRYPRLQLILSPNKILPYIPKDTNQLKVTTSTLSAEK